MNDKKIRLTISLDESDYKKICKIVEKHRPKISKNYVICYAVGDLLKRLENHQLELPLTAIETEN